MPPKKTTIRKAYDYANKYPKTKQAVIEFMSKGTQKVLDHLCDPTRDPTFRPDGGPKNVFPKHESYSLECTGAGNFSGLTFSPGSFTATGMVQCATGVATNVSLESVTSGVVTYLSHPTRVTSAVIVVNVTGDMSGDTGKMWHCNQDWSISDTHDDRLTYNYDAFRYTTLKPGQSFILSCVPMGIRANEFLVPNEYDDSDIRTFLPAAVTLYLPVGLNASITALRAINVVEGGGSMFNSAQAAKPSVPPGSTAPAHTISQVLHSSNIPTSLKGPVLTSLAGGAMANAINVIHTRATKRFLDRGAHKSAAQAAAIGGDWDTAFTETLHMLQA